ncbi:MAG: TetR/AcrR family transcriptional regulator [Lachnospiraceae bacterium]|nr:TetR/AcrR family transcriptional regulator [Lachnospiraceae bacterium]
MRTVKEAEERKNEILDAAEELFVTKGYDKTSTGDILDKVGIARGTLYYHFKSKEDILDAMIERISASMMVRAKAEAANTELSVIERIIRSVMSLKLQSPIGDEILQQVHKPQNALMHSKMQKNMIDSVVPLLAGLVEEGVKQGIFDTPYPFYAAEMIIVYSEFAFDEEQDRTQEELMTGIQAFIHNTEKILGAESGSLTQPMMMFFSQSDR